MANSQIRRRPRRQAGNTPGRPRQPRAPTNANAGANTRSRRARQAAQPYPIAPRPSRGICIYFEKLSDFSLYIVLFNRCPH